MSIEAINTVDTEDGSKSFTGASLDALSFGAVALEVSPTNEALRLAAAGYSMSRGYGPEVTAGIYGVTTLVIESIAAVSVARLVGSNAHAKMNEWIDSKLEKRGIGLDSKPNIVQKAAIALIGGAALSTIVEQRAKRQSSKRELRKYGLAVSSQLAGVCAIQGYITAKGFASPSMVNVGAALLAVGSVPLLSKFAKHKLSDHRDESMSIDVDRKGGVS